MTTQKLGVTPATIKAAEALFMAMALQESVQPIVQAYELEILQRLQLRTDPAFAASGIDRIVLCSKDAYLLSDQDFETYQAEAFKARDAAKLAVSNPQNCPLLEAQSLVLKAQTALLDEMAQFPGLHNLKNVHLLSPQKRQGAVDLTLRLLAPYVRNAKDITTGFAKAIPA